MQFLVFRYALDTLHIYLELPRKEYICPACGTVTSCVHDYGVRVIKNIPLGRNTYLHLKKRRYRCPECGNGFTEGCNNKTKVLKRVCYGVRKFECECQRIFEPCAHQHLLKLNQTSDAG